jgi:PEGA domain
VSPKFRLVPLTVICLVTAGLFLPADAAAQRRAVHGSGGRSAVVIRPAYYYPRFYSPYYFYDPFFWGWGGYGFGYGYGGYWQYPPPYYWGGVYDPTGAARLQITPSQTQVFVDGYFAGIADKFDGTFQRLRVEAGEHELEFYLDGYRTVRQPVLFRREGTITIKHVMEPVTAGQTSERPTPTAPPAGDRQMQNPAGPPAGYRGYPADRAPDQGRGERDDFGTLAIRVQPADAEILIDGQRWDGSEGGSRLSIQLVDGPHRVEIRREGFRPYAANVRIRRGQTETLNVSLTQ